MRPLVGVTACFKENGRGGWHHTVGDKYVRAAIQAVGALPVLIPAIGAEFGDDAVATTEALDRLLDRWTASCSPAARQMSNRITMAARAAGRAPRTIRRGTPRRCP